MKTYQLILQYDGTRYNGWQKQGNTPNTIQERLETLLSRQYGLPVEVAGSGRTDAGVHALAQSASFRVPDEAAILAPEDLAARCNRYLPEDIRVLSACEAPERFHARLSAVQKCYEYRLDIGPVARVFDRKYVTRLTDCLPLIQGRGEAKPAPDDPIGSSSPTAALNFPDMEKAAALAVGTHDYRSFCANRHMKKSTVRTVESISLVPDGGLLILRFVGNGFLYHMVRILTGTLIEVGLGLRPASSVSAILDGRDRSLAGFTAPPQGLFLAWVRY